jgi:hypothetical protein
MSLRMESRVTECIYLVGSEASTLVKIGRSIDVEARLAAIQAMSPVPLALLWQTVGGAELEVSLHRRFESRRSHGEWFDFPDGDAVACVVQALPKIAAELQRVKRAQRVRAERQVLARKLRKIREVWTPPRKPYEPPPPMFFDRQAIIDLAARPTGVTNRALVDALGMCRTTVFRYLSSLKEEGVIKQHGRGRAARWHTVTDCTRDDADDDAE